MSGVDTIRGIAFQLAQTLSDVVDLVVDDHADAVLIEGEDDLVDYQVLDKQGRVLAVRQAKTRSGAGGWGAAELAQILCRWGESENAAETDFAFVTDADLNVSGRALNELINAMRVRPNEMVLRQEASKLGRGGVRLPTFDVLQRVEIRTRMGTTEQVLGQAELRVLDLLSRSRLVVLEDAQHAVGRLYRTLFVKGGEVDLTQRVVRRADVLAALRIDGSDLAVGLAWSDAVASSYRSALLDASRRTRNVFVPLDAEPIEAMPKVLRLLDQQDQSGTGPQPLVTLLTGQNAVLVGATGRGKTTALNHLAEVAAKRGRVPVVLFAAGHTAGSLRRRIRRAVEAALGQPLTVGALDMLLAEPELVLLIDGVSEVDHSTQQAIHDDLQQLASFRPVTVIATGRDLPATVSVASLPNPPAAYRVAALDSARRRQLARTHGQMSPGAVHQIEQRLGDAADNPMLYLMALSVAAEEMPAKRADVYEQFLCGLTARAGLADSLHLAAMGSAWARLIGRGLRTADHYTWLSAISASLHELTDHPVWRGQSSTPEAVLGQARRLGLLTYLDQDTGFAPLHDSFADFLAARAISRAEAALPGRLSSDYDETVLFTIEISGLSDELAILLAEGNPLLACKVSKHPSATGMADADVVGRLLEAFTSGYRLPLLGKQVGLRMCHQPQLTGVVLAGDSYETVDKSTFDTLIRNHPAVMVTPDTGSLQLAVKLWTEAVHASQKPGTRVFQELPPTDPEAAVHALHEYMLDVDEEQRRMIDTTLPSSVRDQVVRTLGPRGIVAYIGDPEPDRFEGLVALPVHYRRGAGQHVQRTSGPVDDDSTLATTTLAQLMRRHPTQQASAEINTVLSELTDHMWPRQ